MNLSSCYYMWMTYHGKKEETSKRIRDERPWFNALFPRSGSMEKFRRNLSQLGKVCGRDIEEIQYVGIQSHGYSYGFQPKAVSR